MPLSALMATNIVAWGGSFSCVSQVRNNVLTGQFSALTYPLLEKATSSFICSRTVQTCKGRPIREYVARKSLVEQGGAPGLVEGSQGLGRVVGFRTRFTVGSPNWLDMVVNPWCVLLRRWRASRNASGAIQFPEDAVFSSSVECWETSRHAR